MAAPGPQGDAAEFDTLLEQLEERELLTLTPDEALARLDELAALRPPAAAQGAGQASSAFATNGGNDKAPRWMPAL